MRASMVGVVVLACAVPAAGQTVTQNTVGRGWFNHLGTHTANNGNYAVGNSRDSNPRQETRNFFVADLSGVSQTIVSARLLLTNPLGGLASPQGAETYTLFDVTTPIAELTVDQAGRTDIFADLGTGSLLGSFNATPASNGTVVSVPLNAAGLASLNAARGGLWGVGGAITTINAGVGVTNEYLFGFTLGQPNDGQTRLEFTVPGPGAAGLLGMAGALAAGRRRRA